MRPQHEHQSNTQADDVHSPAPDRLGPHPSSFRERPFLALSISLVVAVIGWNMASAGSGAAAQVPWDGYGQLSPIADWLDDVIDDLEDIEDDLSDAKEAVNGNQGPLTEPELSRVAADLDFALATIDRILDPNRFPNLDPPNAGYIDTAVRPSTLPGYANDCLNLIRDAVDELGSTLPDAKVVGSHLKTIEHLISRESPHNYRTKAGIE